MGGAGALLFLSILGAFVCARARVPIGAVIFSLIGLAIFVATPAGDGIPDAVADFFSTVDEMSSPALTDTEPAEAGTGAVG
jgi:hypothetical protein